MFPMTPAESWTFLIFMFSAIYTVPVTIARIWNWARERARQRQLEEYRSSK